MSVKLIIAERLYVLGERADREAFFDEYYIFIISGGEAVVKGCRERSKEKREEEGEGGDEGERNW